MEKGPSYVVYCVYWAQLIARRAWSVYGGVILISRWARPKGTLITGFGWGALGDNGGL